MKALQKFPILVLLILFSSLALTAQTDQHYEYAEILVLQKVNNGKSDVKTIYLNSMSAEAGLDEAEINKIENTAELFSVLDQKGWFLFDRDSSQPSNSGPIWINMIFRKKK